MINEDVWLCVYSAVSKWPKKQKKKKKKKTAIVRKLSIKEDDEEDLYYKAEALMTYLIIHGKPFPAFLSQHSF